MNTVGAAAMKLTSRKKAKLWLPLATWGVNYSGLKVLEAKGRPVEERSNRFTTARLRRSADGFISDVFAPWRHKPFIGALKDKEVIVMRVDGNTVTEEGRILVTESSVFGCACRP